MKKSPHRKRARWAGRVLLALAGAILLLLWQFDHALPRWACVRLEDKLSQGIFSFRFDEASVSLARGIRVRNARINLKRTLGPPLITVAELRLKGRIHRDRPFYTWIRSVEADDFVCQPFLQLPESGRGGVDFASYLHHCTVENDWFSEPVRISIRNGDIFSVKCRQLDFQLRARNNLVTADAISAAFHSRGFDESLAGSATYSPTPCEIRARLQGTLTPEVIEGLVDFLEGDTANRIARRFEDYTAPLQVSGEVRWSSSDRPGVPPTQDFRAAVHGTDLSYRGIPLRNISFVIQWLSAPKAGGRERRLAVSPIEIGLPEGTATVSLAWDPRTHATDVAANAEAEPSDLARLIWGRVPSILTNFTFQARPGITAHGRVMPDDFAEKTVLAGSASVAAATARGVPLEDVSFDFSVHGDDILDFTNIAARVFGGPLEGHVRVADYDNDPGLDLALAVRDADCRLVRRHFTGTDLEGGGTLDLDFRLRGPADGDRLDALTGASLLKIRGGNILRVPLFAGLTDFIGRNVPGVDLLLMQSDANVSCALTNGLVTIDRIDVSGNLFSLVASGRCRINKEGMPVDLLAQLRFFHSQSLIGMLARVVTLPVSKMMEFRVTGPIRDAEWSYIGLIDRIKSIFWKREDATEPEREAPAPGNGGSGEENK